MNYEFHVGDYVETIDGRIGYVDGIYTLTDSISWICIHAISNDQLGAYSQTFTPQSKIECHFLRIGSYDFTKKEKKKIELLEYNGSPDWDDSLLLDKINELVDAVNELRSDYDDHIEAHRQTDR